MGCVVERCYWKKILSWSISLPPGVWMFQFSHCSALLFPAFTPFSCILKNLYKSCNWNSLSLCVWLLSRPRDPHFRVGILPHPFPMLLLGDLGEGWVGCEILYLENYVILNLARFFPREQPYAPGLGVDLGNAPGSLQDLSCWVVGRICCSLAVAEGFGMEPWPCRALPVTVPVTVPLLESRRRVRHWHWEFWHLSRL